MLAPPEFDVLAWCRQMEGRVAALESRAPAKGMVDSDLTKKRRLAGKKSAENRRAKFGTAQPQPIKTQTKHRTPPNTTEQSPNKKTEARLEAIFKMYPRRDGVQRKQIGLRRIQKQLKTESDWADFERAVLRYAGECKRKGTKGNFVMQFGTFCGGPWLEYVAMAGTAALTKAQEEKPKLRFDDEIEW